LKRFSFTILIELGNSVTDSNIYIYILSTLELRYATPIYKIKDTWTMLQKSQAVISIFCKQIIALENCQLREKKEEKMTNHT
jgi:hypothetical protein